jgi:hypothetical protein
VGFDLARIVEASLEPIARSGRYTRRRISS